MFLAAGVGGITSTLLLRTSTQLPDESLTMLFVFFSSLGKDSFFTSSSCLGAASLITQSDGLRDTYLDCDWV